MDNPQERFIKAFFIKILRDFTWNMIQKQRYTMHIKHLQIQVKKLLSLKKKDKNYKITPEWFIGFFEAEGSFITTTKKNPRIENSQHASDYFLLLSIKNFFGSGTIRFDLRKSPCALYTISDKDIIAKKLCPLFDRFLLLQNKVQIYESWKSVHFPTCSPGEEKTQKKETHPQWLCGFTDGDGSFHYIFRKQKDYKCRQQATMVFDLSQKSGPFMEEDLQKINALFLENKGVLSKVKNMYHLKVVSIKTHENVIVPFFKKNLLQSRKSIDFYIFSLSIKCFAEKRHLTEEGIKELLFSRQMMRGNRVFISKAIEKVIKG